MEAFFVGTVLARVAALTIGSFLAVFFLNEKLLFAVSFSNLPVFLFAVFHLIFKSTRFFLASIRKYEKPACFSIINYFWWLFSFAVLFSKLPVFFICRFFCRLGKNGKFLICRFFWQKRLKNYQCPNPKIGFFAIFAPVFPVVIELVLHFFSSNRRLQPPSRDLNKWS